MILLIYRISVLYFVIHIFPRFGGKVNLPLGKVLKAKTCRSGRFLREILLNVGVVRRKGASL